MTEATVRAVVLYWSQYVVLGLVHGSDVVRVETPRCRDGDVNADRLRERIVDFAARFLPEEIVIEKRTAKHLGLRPESGQLRVMSIDDAKRILCPGRRFLTHQELYEHILTVDPGLVRMAALQRDRASASLASYWPTAKLLIVAISWAAFALFLDCRQCPRTER